VPRAASSCDHLIVPSRHTYVTAQERLKIPVERISLVPLAPARRPDPPAVEVTSKRPERCILFVGSIEPRKDTSLLVRAYAMLPIDLRRVFPLVICGPDGGDMKRLRRTVAVLHLEGWVHVLGFASERELARLYTRAALVVHPSLGEGFGMTPLEAMQAGAPVVALAAGAVPEVVGDAAVLVPPPFEDEALATAMQRVLESPDLRSALVEAGRCRAAQFTWERTARATLEVYRKVLGG
jgi:alpha-1,3-rhamnosyl/mannosyltransferase